MQQQDIPVKLSEHFPAPADFTGTAMQYRDLVFAYTRAAHYGASPEILATITAPYVTVPYKRFRVSEKDCERAAALMFNGCQ